MKCHSTHVCMGWERGSSGGRRRRRCSRWQCRARRSQPGRGTCSTNETQSDMVGDLFIVSLQLLLQHLPLSPASEAEVGRRSCSCGHIQYTHALDFAFLDSIVGGVFLSAQGWSHSQETGTGPSQLVNISEIYRGTQIFPPINCNRYTKHRYTIKLILDQMVQLW